MFTFLLQSTSYRDRVHDEQLRPDVPRFLHGRRDHLREQPAREGVLTGQDADVSGPKLEAGNLLAQRARRLLGQVHRLRGLHRLAEELAAGFEGLQQVESERTLPALRLPGEDREDAGREVPAPEPVGLGTSLLDGAKFAELEWWTGRRSALPLRALMSIRGVLGLSPSPRLGQRVEVRLVRGPDDILEAGSLHE